MACEDSGFGALPHPFVMLNLFQHPWPDFAFCAAFQARADHGPPDQVRGKL